MLKSSGAQNEKCFKKMLLLSRKTRHLQMFLVEIRKANFGFVSFATNKLHLAVSTYSFGSTLRARFVNSASFSLCLLDGSLGAPMYTFG